MHFTSLVIASDHAGFALKAQIIHHLDGLDITSRDLGAHSEASVDYPMIAAELAHHISTSHSVGILICGSGIGISMAANRFSHIRGALCVDPVMAQLARAHNDANVLILGARLTTPTMAFQCVDTFLNTSWEKGRHETRVEQLSNLPNT